MRLSTWLPVILACTAYTPTLAIPLRGEVGNGWNGVDDRSRPVSNLVVRDYIPDTPGSVIARDYGSLPSLYRRASQQDGSSKRMGGLFPNQQVGGPTLPSYGQQGGVGGGPAGTPPDVRSKEERGKYVVESYNKLIGQPSASNPPPPPRKGGVQQLALDPRTGQIDPSQYRTVPRPPNPSGFSNPASGRPQLPFQQQPTSGGSSSSQRLQTQSSRTIPNGPRQPNTKPRQ